MTLNPSLGTIAGQRLIDGSDVIAIMAVVNGMQAGTQPLSGSSVSSASYITQSVGTGLTAAGTNRATALALANAINNVTTAAASTGVVLPSAATVGIGGSVIIFNNGANAMKVYGAGSDTIDGTAGATGVTLTNALRCQYFVTAANTWISAQLGAVSA